MSGVDSAGDTISIVHRDRKVEVAPNCMGHRLQYIFKYEAKRMIGDKQQHIAIVNIAEMI